MLLSNRNCKLQTLPRLQQKPGVNCLNVEGREISFVVKKDVNFYK